jgi:hypothetical protein
MFWLNNFHAVFCTTGMKQKRTTYGLCRLLSAALMIVTLFWLTISMPFVAVSQQEMAKQSRIESSQANTAQEEESTNPYSNTTEEKSSSSNSFSEEYLHDFHLIDHIVIKLRQSYACHDADAYVAYHGELLVPPPNNIPYYSGYCHSFL